MAGKIDKWLILRGAETWKVSGKRYMLTYHALCRLWLWQIPRSEASNLLPHTPPLWHILQKIHWIQDGRRAIGTFQLHASPFGARLRICLAIHSHLCEPQNSPRQHGPPLLSASRAIFYWLSVCINIQISLSKSLTSAIWKSTEIEQKDNVRSYIESERLHVIVGDVRRNYGGITRLGYAT